MAASWTEFDENPYYPNMLVSFVWIRNTFLSVRNKSGTFSERSLAFLWQPKAAELTLSIVDTISTLNIISSQWEKETIIIWIKKKHPLPLSLDASEERYYLNLQLFAE